MAPMPKKLYFPLALFVAHGVLVVVAMCIRFGPGWNDESPLILVGHLLRWVDYPLVLAVNQLKATFGELSHETLWAIFGIAGGAYWFGLGLLLQWVFLFCRRKLRRA